MPSPRNARKATARVREWDLSLRFSSTTDSGTDVSDHAPQRFSIRPRRDLEGVIGDTKRLLQPKDLPSTLLALLWLVALAVAAAYALVFVTHLPRNITALAWDSDYASGFTLPETLARTGTDGHTVIASSGQWVSLWFGLLTAGLPLHRELWGVAPSLLFAATSLIVGWSLLRVATPRAAVVGVLVSFVVSPVALTFLIAPVAHNTVYPCTALLGAYLIWLARNQRPRRLSTFALPPLIGIVIGTCLASDLLLAVTAMVPLAATAILTGIRRDRRSRLVSLSALTVIVVAIPTARLTSTLMRSLGYETLQTPAKLVPLSELPERAQLLFKGLRTLFDGSLGEHPGAFHTQLALASDIAMSAALLALAVVGSRTTARLVRSAFGKSSPETAVQLARSLHVVYWFVSAVAACVAFWLAAETGDGTNLHEAYYGTVIFSVAAVVPLLLLTGSPARWLLPVGASMLFLCSLVGLAGNDIDLSVPVVRNAATITKLARANHVSVGYGGYGVASNLTWNTHGRVTIRPLMSCASPSGICPFYMADVPSWYVARPRRTFLLINVEEPWITSFPSGLGRPLAAYAFGPMRMYVYRYDIASHLGPQP